MKAIKGLLSISVISLSCAGFAVEQNRDSLESAYRSARSFDDDSFNVYHSDQFNIPGNTYLRYHGSSESSWGTVGCNLSIITQEIETPTGIENRIVFVRYSGGLQVITLIPGLGYKSYRMVTLVDPFEEGISESSFAPNWNERRQTFTLKRIDAESPLEINFTGESLDQLTRFGHRDGNWRLRIESDCKDLELRESKLVLEDEQRRVILEDIQRH